MGVRERRQGGDEVTDVNEEQEFAETSAVTTAPAESFEAADPVAELTHDCRLDRARVWLVPGTRSVWQISTTVGDIC